jgi:hypothetical protein
MGDRSDELSWDRILSDREPRDEGDRLLSADPIRTAVGPGTQMKAEGGEEDDSSQRLQWLMNEARAEKIGTTYPSEETIIPRPYTEQAQREQVGELSYHMDEKPLSGTPAAVRSGEDAANKVTIGKDKNEMQDVDKTINSVSEPVVGRVADTRIVVAQPLVTPSTLNEKGSSVI